MSTNVGWCVASIPNSGIESPINPLQANGRMTMGSDGQPSANDPIRKAVASSVVVERSVLVWMELGEAERLYLESAECLDRISRFAAEAIRMKDVSENVTRRSSSVTEAVGNSRARRVGGSATACMPPRGWGCPAEMVVAVARWTRGGVRPQAGMRPVGCGG